VDATEIAGQLDVLERIEGAQQVEILEDEAQAPGTPRR
jgi:hypothetical protein